MQSLNLCECRLHFILLYFISFYFLCLKKKFSTTIYTRSTIGIHIPTHRVQCSVPKVRILGLHKHTQTVYVYSITWHYFIWVSSFIKSYYKIKFYGIIIIMHLNKRFRAHQMCVCVCIHCVRTGYIYANCQTGVEFWCTKFKLKMCGNKWKYKYNIHILCGWDWKVGSDKTPTTLNIFTPSLMGSASK